MILVVEKSTQEFRRIEALLQGCTCLLIHAATLHQASQLLSENEFALTLIHDSFFTELCEGEEETRRAIRKYPFIFTTENSEDFSECAYALGAFDCLRRPFSSHELTAKVNVFIRLHHREQAGHSKLARSEENFRSMIEAVEDYAIFMLSPEGLVSTWNRGAEKVMGYSADEIIGRPFSVFFPEEEKAEALHELDDAMLFGRADDERWHVRKNGERFWALGVTTVVFSESHEVLGYTKVMRDFTERRRSEVALRESELRFRSLFDQGAVGLVHFDFNGHMVLVNQKFCEMLGYTKEEAIGLSLWDITHPDDRERFIQLQQDLIRKCVSSGSMHKVYLTKSGQKVNALVSVSTVIPEDGQEPYMMAVVQDVAATLDAEERLRRSEEEFRLLADSVPHIVWTTDRFGKPTFINGRWYDYTGFRVDMPFSEQVKEAYHPDDRESALAVWKLCLKEGQTFEREIRIRNRLGQYRWHLFRSIAHRAEDGTCIRWIGTSTDIDEQKMAQQASEEACTQAESASLKKSAFLAHMSHEIRTPLGAILGYCELLKDIGTREPERLNFIDAIARNGRELSYLINDILDLSKVEAGRLDIDRRSVMLSDLLDDVISTLMYKAKEKGIGLSLHKRRLPVRISTDPTRFRQILINLIGNAIKFTDRGSVKVKVRLETTGGSSKLRIAVCDTGCGISPQDATRLFQAYTQGSAAHSRLYGGTGLGLMLSRQLAQMLGGDVKLLESVPNRGSIFIATIDPEPLSFSRDIDDADSGEDKDCLLPASMAGIKILLAEDAPDNRFLLSRFLSGIGAYVDAVENGSAAVHSAMTKHYDLILMDIEMPVLDGYGATHELRARGYQEPIIALTAHAMQDERLKCLAAGCDFHLSKPISYHGLIEAISKISRRDGRSFYPRLDS